MESSKSKCISYPELKILHCCLAGSGAHDCCEPFWEDASNGCSPADHVPRVGSAADLSIMVLENKNERRGCSIKTLGLGGPGNCE